MFGFKIDYEKELQRGAEAKQLIEDPVFREAMDALEKELDDVSLSVPTTDKDLCADVIMRRQVFESIKGKLVEYIQTGNMAKAQIEIEVEVEKKPEFKR